MDDLIDLAHHEPGIGGDEPYLTVDDEISGRDHPDRDRYRNEQEKQERYRVLPEHRKYTRLRSFRGFRRFRRNTVLLLTVSHKRSLAGYPGTPANAVF
jgi:hypothetical protein